ncbi:MAG TPA: 23S rRNA pseudouridine(1911/1915/1917) synthase RluD [Cellvibrionaceae bacterium]
MTETIIEHISVPASMRGQRFDQAAASLFPAYSRARLQSWIKSGELTVNGATVKPREKLLGGEVVHLQATLALQDAWQAEDIALDIVFEDDQILVVNKPSGLVVHPAAGNYSGTLVNALLHYLPEQGVLPRAGIVHRLDKDTTGLMVVAKTLPAHANLVAQLQERSVSRIYEAIAQGAMTGGGVVEAAIGRHPKNRKQMAVAIHGGKPAITHYQLLHRFTSHSHIRLRLETGRTHQIRVHMAHINYPLVGDPVYGKRFRAPARASAELIEQLKTFPRQALHAAELGLLHPATGEAVSWQVPLPGDLVGLLEALRQADD